MNVAQLKKMIADLPDDTPVLRTAFDHSYREVRKHGVNCIDVMCVRGSSYYEYNDGEYVDTDEAVVKALVIE